MTNKQEATELFRTEDGPRKPIALEVEIGSAEWHDLRRTGIGASEIAAICDAHPYQTAVDVWNLKTGREAPFEGNAKTEAGLRLEPVILDYVADMYSDKALRRSSDMFWNGEYCFATPDGFLTDGTDQGGLVTTEGLGEIYVVEAKLSTNRIDEPHHYHWLQLQYQLEVMGLTKGVLAYLIQGWDFRYFEFELDRELGLMAIAEDWYKKHVVEGVEPEPTAIGDADKLWKEPTGKQIEATPAVVDHMILRQDLKSQIKDLESACKRLEEEIKREVGDADLVTLDGKKIFSYSYVPAREVSYTSKAYKKPNWTKI